MSASPSQPVVRRKPSDVLRARIERRCALLDAGIGCPKIELAIMELETLSHEPGADGRGAVAWRGVAAHRGGAKPVIAFVVVAVTMAIAAGCGGGSGSRPVARAPDRWRAMTWEERHARMTWTLLPAMARAFHRFERTPYPRLACVTCHGRDAEAVGYRMPSRALPALDPAHMPDEDDRAMRFMREVVTPLANRTMDAGGSVTCFSCHASARAGGRDRGEATSR